jgi:hypothetical protein
MADHKKNRIRLAFALAILTIGLAGVGATQAMPSAADVYTGCNNPGDQTDMPKAECNALVALYDGTAGGSWTDKTGWKITDAPCFWDGVTCTGGHVTVLSFLSNNLTNSIPAALGNLPNLIELDLADNSLTGSIPLVLGNLSNLENLDLNGNSLTGNIPTQLGNLTNLLYLYLGSNSLTGKIPTQLGNLSNLEQLGLGSNKLKGGIPKKFGALSNLDTLLLTGNKLTGGIPTQLGNLTNLTYLFIQGNTGLTGWLPSRLTNLTSMSNFFFNGTSLCERPDTAFQDWLDDVDLGGTVLSTGVICNIIFEDGFESANFSAWNAVKTGGGDLKVCLNGAINGIIGMCVKNMTNNTKFVTDSGLSATSISVQFNLDPNGLKLQNNKIIRIFQSRDGAKAPHWLQLRKNDGNFQLRALAKLDGPGFVKTLWTKITNKPHLIEIEWSAASGAGNHNGYVKLYVGGQLRRQKGGLNNDTFVVKKVKLGFTNRPLNFWVRGVFFIDDFMSSDSGFIGK